MSRVLKVRQPDISTNDHAVRANRRIGVKPCACEPDNNILLLVAVAATSYAANQLSVLVERHASLPYLKPVRNSKPQYVYAGCTRLRITGRNLPGCRICDRGR